MSSAAARLCQQLDRIDRQDAPAPQRAVEGRIASALGGEIDRGRDRVVARSPPCSCRRKRTAASEAYGDAQRLQRVLEAHQAEPDRTVPQVRAPRLRDGVEIDVDDVVEHPHRGRHRALQPRRDRARPSSTWLARLTEPRLQTATSSSEVLSVISVHRFDEWMTPTWLLRRAQIAGVLEGDPGMAGLEQHGQHAPPQIGARGPA